jgi:hypothetical protein
MAHRVKLRRERFETEANTLGLASQTKQAAAIGVHKSIHSRALRGHIDLSAPYVIGVLMLVGDARIRAKIRDLFDVDAAEAD